MFGSRQIPETPLLSQLERLKAARAAHGWSAASLANQLISISAAVMR